MASAASPEEVEAAALRVTVESIDDEFAAKMRGVSWHEGCPVPMADLRRVHVPYLDFEGRTQRGTETRARILDLAITEFGHATVEKSATFEVMLRRMWAIRDADKQGHWEQAALLEEIPSEKHPELHEVIVGKLLKTHQLIVNADSVKASSTSVNDDV